MIWTNRRAFHWGRILLPPASFPCFLPLSVNNISVPFPCRCRAMEGEEGKRFCRAYLLVCPGCVWPGGASREPGCPGVALQGCLAPWPKPHHEPGAGPGREGRRGSCPGAASLLSSGGDEPLSSQVGGGWSFLLESAQWAMDLGRLPWKCNFMKSQTQSAPEWWKCFWKPQLSFRKSLIENNPNFCVVFNNEIILFHRITEGLRWERTSGGHLVQQLKPVL